MPKMADGGPVPILKPAPSVKPSGSPPKPFFEEHYSSSEPDDSGAKAGKGVAQPPGLKMLPSYTIPTYPPRFKPSPKGFERDDGMIRKS
eukprot:5137443-Amphidinium_carterae.1